MLESESSVFEETKLALEAQCDDLKSRLAQTEAECQARKEDQERGERRIKDLEAAEKQKCEEEKQDRESSEKVTLLEEQVKQLKAAAAAAEAQTAKQESDGGERQQMVAILNEKSRENSKLKKENNQLLERLAASGRLHEEQVSVLTKEKVRG